MLLLTGILVVLFMLEWGRVIGPIFIPGAIGAVLVARARHTWLEASLAEREVRIVVARVGPTIRTRVAFDELEYLRIEPTRKDLDKGYLLRVGRTRGEPITLDRADTADMLESEREVVGRFLLESGAMSGPRARVETADLGEATELK